MLLNHIINNLSLSKEAVVLGEAVLNFELNQVCLAMTDEDLMTIDLNHALIVSPIDLFDSDSVLDYFENLAKDSKISSLFLTGSCKGIKSTLIYKLCSKYNITLCCLGEDISPVSAMNRILKFYKKHLRQIEGIIQNHYLERYLATLDLGIARIIRKPPKSWATLW